MPTIEFNSQYVPQNFLDIDSVGNVCIEAVDEEDGFYYYLLIKTSLGTSSIFQYGPVIPDLDQLPDNYSALYSRQNFNDRKILALIKQWLNDRYKRISSAKIVDEQIFLDNFRDITQVVRDYGAEVY